MNKTYRALLSTLFLIILAVDCIFIINKATEYRLYTKTLLMPLLYVLMALQTEEGTHKRSKLFLTFAIFLSFAGDFCLMYEPYFTLGLIFFLFALISYSSFFLRLKAFSSKRVVAIIVCLVLFAVFAFLLLSNLWPGISDQGLEVQVILYCLGMGFMFVTSVNTSASRRIRKVAYQNFIPGTVLFIISDSVLAVDKFIYVPDKALSLHFHILYAVVTIVTYGIAQLLLVSGAIRIIGK